MSDFNSSFWSVFIATVTLLGIVACLVLLWVTANKKSVGNADNTTKCKHRSHRKIKATSDHNYGHANDDQAIS